MVNDVLSDLEDNFRNTVGALKRDLAKVRTGRANPGMLDGLRVDYYGTQTPINQVGAIKVPDARLITIQPWEKNMVPVIEKAIVASDLGLNPSSDGTIIRLPIPALTTERRKELTRQVKDMGEKAKIALRGHRRDANELLKMAQKEGDIGEDQMHRALGNVQDLTDKYTKKVDDIIEEKQEEILEV